MKKLVFLFVFLLFVSIVSAAPPFIVSPNNGFSIEPIELTSAKINQPYTFQIHVFNLSNGVPITSSISCYVHVYDTNGNHIAILENSTNDERFDYGFFVDKNNFTSLGSYQAKFQCNNSILGGSTEIDFMVTPTGNILTTAQSLIYGIIWIVSLLIFLGLIIAGIALPSKNNTDAMTGYIIAISNMKYVKIFCLIFAYLALLITMFLSWMLSYSYLEFIFLSTLFQWMFYILSIAALPFFILSVYFLITNWIRDSKLAEMLSRGLNVK